MPTVCPAPCLRHPEEPQVPPPCTLASLSCVGVPASVVDCSRSRCSAAQHRGRAYLFGGSGPPDRFNGGRLRSDLCCVDTETGAWRRVPCSGAAFPEARMHHATVVRRGMLVVHGGLSPRGALLPDMWAVPLDDDLHEWRRVALRTADGFDPPGMGSHAAAVSGTALYLHGGTGAMSPLSASLYRFCFSDQVLAPVQSLNAGPLLYGHSLEAADGLLYAFGGKTYHQGNHEAASNQLFTFELATGIWRAVAFALRSERGGLAAFAAPPLAVLCVRATRQLWYVSRGGGVYYASLPRGVGDSSVLFQLRGHPDPFPEPRAHPVVFSAGRALWVLFGEEIGNGSGGGGGGGPAIRTPAYATSVSRLLSEDHVTTRRCFADVNVFDLDAGTFATSPFLAHTTAAACPPAKQRAEASSAEACYSLATPSKMLAQGRVHPSKTSMLTRLLREKHDFDKLRGSLSKQDLLTRAEVAEYSDLLDTTVEKYLDTCHGSAPRKRAARTAAKRRSAQKARLHGHPRRQEPPPSNTPPPPPHAGDESAQPPSQPGVPIAAVAATPVKKKSRRRPVRTVNVTRLVATVQACCRAALSAQVAHDLRAAAARRDERLRRRRSSAFADDPVGAASAIQRAARRKSSQVEAGQRRQRQEAAEAEAEATAERMEQEMAAQRIQTARRQSVASRDAQQRQAAKVRREREAEAAAVAQEAAHEAAAAARIQGARRRSVAQADARQRQAERARSVQEAEEAAAAQEADAAARGIQRGAAKRRDSRASEKRADAATRIQAVQRGRAARRASAAAAAAALDADAAAGGRGGGGSSSDRSSRRSGQTWTVDEVLLAFPNVSLPGLEVIRQARALRAKQAAQAEAEECGGSDAGSEFVALPALVAVDPGACDGLQRVLEAGFLQAQRTTSQG